MKFLFQGDESHTATEGEEEIDDEEQDAVKKAREVRRQELNINFKPPTEDTQSSDSGSETEVSVDVMIFKQLIH